MLPSPTAVSDTREEILAGAVNTMVRSGYRVESQTSHQAVVVKGHRPNHLLHLILSIVTAGMWLFVWLAIIIFGGEKRRVITVDTFGKVHRVKG